MVIRQLYRAFRPVLFALPPETAHRLVHTGLETVQQTPIERGFSNQFRVDNDRLQVEAFGQSFDNPVGVAAGFDKNAELPSILGALGFGHVEVGGVTAVAQSGNGRPRMFRLVEDEALINRMGLNNHGADVIGERLSNHRREIDYDGPIGVNIALSESTPTDEAPADYQYTYKQIAEGADYVAVNVSCPNSEGMQELQQRDSLSRIIDALTDAGAETVLVKLAPELSFGAVEDVMDLVDIFNLDGVITTNTTTERPESLESVKQGERGGLSGAPLEDQATRLVRAVAERTDVPIIGVGGVSDAAGAYAKIRAGASLVQLYTGLVYQGPTLARDINAGLLQLLKDDGFDSIESAIGADL
ncbi:quinone-dependent dihydroorotate dehydrogenase [Haloquadratum walsbyi]|uniref:quinone-dependent dihydroorotate dehydrogenase n=1 Tax=Haloquadratum walsbyi TaxID=293091 RepID=UPI00064FDE8B|nr:quinone-dependent dihydroorotate dehydrogenase [Haloquadratum walsbyi]